MVSLLEVNNASASSEVLIRMDAHLYDNIGKCRLNMLRSSEKILIPGI